MSRENWGEKFSNTETTVFEKGDWTITEDGEKIWSIYFKGSCVDPVSDYNHYIEFQNGFLLCDQRSSVSKFALISEHERKPIFKVEGQNCRYNISDSLIMFYNSDSQPVKSFDIISFTEVIVNEEEQISINF